MSGAVTDGAASALHEFALGDEIVCLDTRTDRLRLANAVGAVIWRHWARGATRAETVAALGERFDAEPARLEEDVTRTFASLEAGGEFEIRPMADYEPILDAVPDRELVPVRIAHLHLPGVRVRLRVESESVGRDVERLFPLPPSDAARADPDRDVAFDIDVYDESGRFPVVHDGRTLDTGLTASDAAVKSLREIEGLAARRSPWTAVIHASAVEKGGRAVLFPAVGGSGKTTLAAWLAASGYRLLNDDTVPLLGRNGTLRTVPVAMSVKAGSLDVLRERWPDIDARPARGSSDRPIRYVPVPPERACPSDTRCALVALPAWQPDLAADATIEPVPPAHVLRDIVEGGCTMRRPLVPDELGRLVAWLDATPCVRLTYRDLDAARRRLDETLAAG